MKARCRRCQNTVEYTDNIPPRCPYCNGKELIAEKNETERFKDGEKSDIESKYLDVKPVSKRRRFLLIPLLLFDLSIPVAGYLLNLFFGGFINLLGIIVLVFGILRLIYYFTMTYNCLKGIKSGIRSVYLLTDYLYLKKRRDTLIVLYRQIKYGILYDVEIKNGEEILVKR